jgi:hypothetical protein
VKEHPLFVPFGGEHLAAVLTLPDNSPRALVLFLQGLGAPRSHKNRVWTRAARELADRRIASVRMDYPEIGDTTGVLSVGEFNPVGEAMAVMELSLEATGVSSFGIIGNCLGAKTGFAIASREAGCVSLGCMLLGSPENILEGKGRTATGRALRKTGRKTPRLRKIARRVLRTERMEPRMRFLPDVQTSLRSTSVLFQFLGKAELGRRLQESVASISPARGRESRPRIEVTTMPITGTSGFRIPLAVQPVVIRELVDWMDQTLPAGSEEEGPVAAGARPAGGDGDGT